MLKGCQREMIVVHTRDSELFESAYLILRPQSPREGRADMVAEANRILGREYRTPPSRRSFCRLWFCMGLLCGALMGILLTLLLS